MISRGLSDAALSLLALKGPTPELIDALPAFEAHDGFGEAVTLVLQLRGPDALEDLVGLFARLDDDARSTILGQLHRLHAAPTAIALRDHILPNAADVLVPRIVECALQLPVCCGVAIRDLVNCSLSCFGLLHAISPAVECVLRLAQSAPSPWSLGEVQRSS